VCVEPSGGVWKFFYGFVCCGVGGESVKPLGKMWVKGWLRWLGKKVSGISGFIT